MRANITFEETVDGIEVGIFEDADEIERLKAFNHNTGDTLPQRQFIPNDNQNFKKSIMNKVNVEIDVIRSEERQAELITLEDPQIQESISMLVGGDLLDQLLLDILNG